MTKPFYAGSQIDADVLNEIAMDGWEFVSAVTLPHNQNNDAVMIFKRRTP